MENKGKSKIVYYIFLVLAIVGVIISYNIYQKNNFNDFVKSEQTPYVSTFIRDKEVKYFEYPSYKIESKVLNDAMFYKEIEVKPDTAYRVTCMVKTKDVKPEIEVSTSGAHISIEDTTEKSKSITGTTDWQQIELLFNSKNREKVKVGFRLGGYEENCTGEAWFSDFKIEEGYKDTTTNWNVVCFLMDNLDVQINGKRVKLAMMDEDKEDMRYNMQRFKEACKTLSGNNMTVDYDIIEIVNPITSLSYDEENGYHVTPKDVEKLISKYMEKTEYDHIFIALRMGNENHPNDIQINDWIGLGAMDYYGVGFSNIRLPNSDKSYIYKYSSLINTFPEEVFVHEFIHSLERTLKEYGDIFPELHDYEKYGYRNQRLVGLKNWYKDYMQCNIKTSEGTTGLDKMVYNKKPIQKSDFEYSYDLKEFKQPENLIESIGEIIQKLKNKIGG